MAEEKMGPKRLFDGYKMIQAMDTLAKMLNDEGSEELWLSEGVPDGTWADGYWELAHDAEFLDHAAAVFCEVIRAHGRHGFFAGDGEDMAVYGAGR